MKRSSKLIIGIVLALVIVASSTLVFAANDETPAIIIGGDSSNTQNTVENTTENTTSQNYTPLNTSTTYNTTNTTNTLPKTGVTDGYVVAILMVVCAISAIYRKILSQRLILPSGKADISELMLIPAPPDAENAFTIFPRYITVPCPDQHKF